VSRIVAVERHLSEAEIEDLIRREKDRRMLERLIFIRSLYDGEPVEKAARRLFGGGRSPKLSVEERDELRETLAGRDDWTTREARSLIRERFGVEYPARSVRRLLRGLGLRYCKPYPRDYRRPGDAEERLKKSVENA